MRDRDKAFVTTSDADASAHLSAEMRATGVLAAYAVIAVTAPVGRLPTVCPFRLLTGHRCPLCGLTRATHALARGHLRASLAMNPLVVIWPGVMAWLIFSRDSRSFWLAQVGRQRARCRRLAHRSSKR